ncbi:uncharacterized protein BKA78DRAFT_8009 [Phyllosticta capitalensis]|uniref:uncharacterized protein n=1 Tax=Phyllosticta capitalensis TaxID=121624 RepID=UPI003130383C
MVVLFFSSLFFFFSSRPFFSLEAVVFVPVCFLRVSLSSLLLVFISFSRGDIHRNDLPGRRTSFLRPLSRPPGPLCSSSARRPFFPPRHVLSSQFQEHTPSAVFARQIARRLLHHYHITLAVSFGTPIACLAFNQVTVVACQEVQKPPIGFHCDVYPEDPLVCARHQSFPASIRNLDPQKEARPTDDCNPPFRKPESRQMVEEENKSQQHPGNGDQMIKTTRCPTPQQLPGAQPHTDAT